MVIGRAGWMSSSRSAKPLTALPLSQDHQFLHLSTATGHIRHSLHYCSKFVLQSSSSRLINRGWANKERYCHPTLLLPASDQWAKTGMFHFPAGKEPANKEGRESGNNRSRNKYARKRKSRQRHRSMGFNCAERRGTVREADPARNVEKKEKKIGFSKPPEEKTNSARARVAGGGGSCGRRYEEEESR